MASKFVATKGAVAAFNTKMDEVRTMMQDKGVPINQRRQIEAHFSFLWGSSSVYNEAQILGLLPRVLRDPILDKLYLDILSECALFTRLKNQAEGLKGSEVLNRLAMVLTHSVSNFGLIVMEEGQYGDEMFFIDSGEVDVFRQRKTTTVMSPSPQHHPAAAAAIDTAISDGGDPKRDIHAYVVGPQSDWRCSLGPRLGRLGPKAFFGERAVMTRGNGKRRGVRTRTIVSRSACHFHVLKKHDLDRLRSEIPPLNMVLDQIEGLGAPSRHDRPLTGDRNGSVVADRDSAAIAHEMGQMKEQLSQLAQAVTQAQAASRAMEAKLDRALATIDKLAGEARTK